MAASTFVIIVVFVLDLIAFGLGIGAEQRRATGHLVQDKTARTQYCQYTSDIATGLSLGALLFLVASQVLILAATRCLCCGKALKPGAARAFAVIFFILNWMTFVIAVICFLAGAVQNAKHVRYFLSYLDKSVTCSAIRKDTFAGGVAFTFFTFILSVAYYLCSSKAQEGTWKNKYNNRGETGVNMASYS